MSDLLDINQGQIPDDLGIPELEGVEFGQSLVDFDRDLGMSWGVALGKAKDINEDQQSSQGDWVTDRERSFLPEIEQTRRSLQEKIQAKGYSNQQLRQVSGRSIDVGVALKAVDNGPGYSSNLSQQSNKQSMGGKSVSSDNEVQQSDAEDLKRAAGAVVDQITKQPTEKSAIDELVELLKANLKQDDNVTVQLGSRKVYQGDKGKENRYKDLTLPEKSKVDALLKGNDVKGSVKVFVNGAEQPSFHLKAGKEVRNDLDFQPQQKPEVKEAAVQKKEPQSESSSLSEQIAELKKELASTREALQTTNQRLEAVESRQVEIANPKVSQWVKGIQQKYQGHLQQRKEGFAQKIEQGKQAIAAKISQGKQFTQAKATEGKQAVASKIDQGKQFTQNKATEGKQAVSSKVDQGKQAVTQAWMKGVIEPSLNKILDKFGSDIGNDMKAFHTKDYQITQGPKGLHIARTDGTAVTPQNMNAKDQKVMTALSQQAESLDTKQNQQVSAPKIKAIKQKM